MYSLAFDPAARYSGAALLDPDGALVEYWTLDAGLLDKTNPQTNLRRMRYWVNKTSFATKQHPAVVQQGLWITVENLSHFMSNPAPALRVQGVLLDVVDQHFPDVDPLLSLPAVWQNALGWKKTKDSKMTSKMWAKWQCAAMGYDVTPTPGSKAAEDARDAVLIARWRQLKEAGKVD